MKNRCSRLAFRTGRPPGRGLALELLLIMVVFALICSGSALASTIRAAAASGLPGATVQVPIVFDLLAGENNINKIQIVATVTADPGAAPIAANLGLYNPPYGSLTPQAAPNNVAPTFNTTPSTTTFDLNWSFSNSRFVAVSGPQTDVEACRMLVTLPATAVGGTTYTVHLVAYNAVAKTGTTVKVAGGGPIPAAGSSLGADAQITVTPHALTVGASASPDTVVSGGTTDLTGTASDSYGHGVYSWEWDDGGAGGSFSDASAQNPSYTAPANLTGHDLTITLTLTAYCDVPDPAGAQGSVSLTVSATAPGADFSAFPTSGWAPLDVAFTDTSGNAPTSWAWDFGDGGASTVQNPSHTYTTGGSFTVTLTATNEGGSDTKTDYIQVASFLDVGTGFWAWQQVEACVAAGIVTGYDDGTYDPDGVVTRAQMAVFVSRALAGGDSEVPTAPATAHFPDVDTGYWAFQYIEYAYDQDIVNGYSDGYHPDEYVNRAQMAVFIARAIVTPLGEAGLASYTPPTTASFTDVPVGFWAYTYVEYLKDHDVVHGYDDGTYAPTTDVTRDQMAVFVSHAFGLAP